MSPSHERRKSFVSTSDLFTISEWFLFPLFFFFFLLLRLLLLPSLLPFKNMQVRGIGPAADTFLDPFYASAEVSRGGVLQPAAPPSCKGCSIRSKLVCLSDPISLAKATASAAEFAPLSATGMLLKVTQLHYRGKKSPSWTFVSGVVVLMPFCK